MTEESCSGAGPGLCSESGVADSDSSDIENRSVMNMGDVDSWSGVSTSDVEESGNDESSWIRVESGSDIGNRNDIGSESDIENASDIENSSSESSSDSVDSCDEQTGIKEWSVLMKWYIMI